MVVDAASVDDVLAAGQAALSRGAWQDARSHFEDAAAASDRPAAWEGLSWSAWWLEDVAACLDARERAYHGYREARDLRGAARMALWLSDDHVEFWGAEAVAAGWFQRAARLLAEVEPCPEHGWLAAFQAHASLERHDLAAARRLAEEARLAGRRQGAVALEMFAVASEGVTRVAQGEVSEGLRCLDEAAAAALAGEYEELAPAAWSCCLVMASCEQLRDYQRGAQWCRKIKEFSLRMRTRFLQGVCRAHYGAILTWHGSWDEADDELQAALVDLTVNRPSWRADALVRLADLRRRQGRHEEAQELFEQVATHPLAPRGLAALSLDRDDPATARDLLERALRQIPSERRSARVDILELLVHADVALADPDAAAARLEELRALAAAVDTEPVRAAVRCCEGLLAALTGDLETARDQLEGAVDAYIRGGAPLEAGRARLHLARTLQALDRLDAAAREAQQALRSLEELGAAADRRRADAVLAELRPSTAAGDAGPLTDRQVQVLRLIAEGRSDQDIAAQLVLSEHTVHRHVANIYTRLGCSSRAAAVAQASRLGLL